jgi:pyrimidine operon attenuation protein/uracil phosphoribosyltransferase
MRCHIDGDLAYRRHLVQLICIVDLRNHVVPLAARYVGVVRLNVRFEKLCDVLVLWANW